MRDGKFLLQTDVTQDVDGSPNSFYANTDGIQLAFTKHTNCIQMHFNPNPHGMFWTKVIYDLASSEPYS